MRIRPTKVRLRVAPQLFDWRVRSVQLNKECVHRVDIREVRVDP